LEDDEGIGIFNEFATSFLNGQIGIVRKDFPAASGDLVRSHCQRYHWTYEIILPDSPSREALEALFEKMRLEVCRLLDDYRIPKSERTEESSKATDFRFTATFTQLGYMYTVTVIVYTGDAKYIQLVVFQA
jgi:hypothetical protein